MGGHQKSAAGLLLSGDFSDDSRLERTRAAYRLFIARCRSSAYFIILAWGAGEIFERCRLPRAAVWVAAILILSVCAGRTMGQLRFWQNTKTLFGHAIAVTKGNDVAHCNLGEYYFGKNRLDEAIDNYRKAICNFSRPLKK
jgi:tetratricopeptide (TPR) repeat protein